MGLFTSTEKKIADSLVSVFTKAKEIENSIFTDVKDSFEKARTEALAVNDEVNKLKAELQIVLAKSASLHQAAVAAAQAAQAAAEADVERFKAAVIAHTSDMNTQTSQLITPPPTVDANTTQ